MINFISYLVQDILINFHNFHNLSQTQVRQQGKLYQEAAVAHAVQILLYSAEKDGPSGSRQEVDQDPALVRQPPAIIDLASVQPL